MGYTRPAMRPCPYCHVEIDHEMVTCDHCGFRVPPPHARTPADTALKNCPYCAEQILTAAIKCRHCGSMLDARGTLGSGQESGSTAVRSKSRSITGKSVTQARRGGLGGAAAGGCGGLVLAVMIFGGGLLLSFTGIGAVIGVPLMLVSVVMAIVMFFAGVAIGGDTLSGACPYCQTVVSAHRKQGVDCPGCGKRILIRGTTFQGVD